MNVSSPISPPQQRVSAVIETAQAAADNNRDAYLRSDQQDHIEIQEISPKMFDRHARYLADMLVWENDGICLGRAATSAMHINRVHGIGYTPVTEAYAAGVAILKSADSQTIQDANWRFHAGVVVRPKGQELQVIDYLTDGKPMPLTDWAAAYGVPMEKIDIRSPFASWTDGGASDFGWMERSLNDTWGKKQRGERVTA